MESPSIVICDEKDSASHLESLLHNLGYKNVAIASDRKELQTLLKSGSADLLIIDADCGEKEKCLTLSHTFCQTNDIPIIYVIPHTGQWLEQNAAMLDMYGHLFKPVRQRELHLTIEGTLSRYKSKKDLERQLQELSLIHDISQAAASIRDIDELLKYITQRIGQLMRASAIYVALDEPESSQVNIRYWSSPIPNLALQQIPCDSSLIGDVIRNRRTMLINENFGDNVDRLRGVFLKDGVVQIPKAWLGIPIMFLHQSLGAICVQDFVQEQAFSGEQVSLLETIAASVAVALKNAQLFTSFQEELAQRAARELELQENKQKLETLFRLLPVGVSVLDERKNILFANPALAGILGVSEKELNGQTCARNRYFSSDGLPMKQEEYACEQAFREKRAVYNVEAGIKTHEDGNFTWLNISALPMDLYDWRAMVVTADITQRKNNENEIRRREAELLESHQIAHMGRWEIDRETFEMRWSEGIYNLLELDPRTVKPSYETFISFSHPDDLEKTIQEITNNARQRKDTSITSRLLMPDGRIKWIHQRCRVECNQEGKVVRTVGIAHDISELKLAEEQLHLHSIALNAAANGIMITDRDGVIQWVNLAFTNITGYALEEAQGNTPRLLKSGLQTPQFYENLWATIRAGNTWHGEMYDRHKDGHLILIEQYISPVRNAQNVISHFVVIMIDISERSEIQKRLKLQSTALEAADNAIVITNPKGFIEWVNPAFAALTGYSSGEAVGAHMRILKSGAHSEEFYRDLWAQIRAGKVWHGQMYNRRKNGEYYHEEMTITPVMDEKNAISHFIAIKQDVTKRVEAELRLKQYAEDQAALHAVAAASTAQMEPTDLLNTTLDVILAIPHLAVSCGWVLLFDETSGKTQIAASRNMSEAFLQAEVNDAGGPCPVCVEASQNATIDIKANVISECPRIPQELIEKENLATHVAIPLKVGSQVLGVLNLGWRDVHEYPERHRTLLSNIGTQISLALHHAMLYQEALQVNRLRLLNQIGQAINASLEPDIVFSNMLELVCNALAGQEGSIMLVEPPGGDLVVRHAFLSQIDKFRGRRIKKGEGFAGRAAEQGKTFYINDVQQDPRWHGELAVDGNFQTRSILCAPIWHGQNVIGVIEVVNSQKGGFTREDVLLIDAITPIASVAIKNSQLFSLTLRRVKELDTLNHIAQAVTTSLDSNLIIRNALERIQQHFDASYVGLFKWNAETETLVLSQMRKDGALQTVEHRFTKDETLVGEVLQSKKPSMMTSIRVDEARPDKVRDLLDSQRHSWMAAPMMISDQVIGAIEVTSETSGFYTLRQLSVLESIAATLSIALENARLYEELKHALREQERAQAYLIQSEKSAALGRLSATVAHEINNPLQAIQGCLGLFGEEMGGQNRPEKLTRYLSMVEGEIERIASIVRRMRDFYRPSSIGFQAVDLTEVIKSVLDLSAKQLQNSRISLQTHWPEELPQIQANSDHLKQVFLNLILNAIDAMPDGGTLTICVEPAVFVTDDNSQVESVRITFSDTGHGMSSEVLARLFEPFHTTKSHGTGLGLYVSKGIVAAHNGKIEVQSQPGVGTTFTLFLPITENHL